MPLHYYKVTISISFEVPDHLFSEVLPFRQQQLISLMTNTVVNYERQELLGYYPALEYLFAQGVIGQDIVDAFESMCRFVAHAATSAILSKLKAAFSQVQIISLHHMAYNIPAVRPAQKSSYIELSEHYRPNLLHMELELSQIHKQPVAKGYEKFVRHLIHRWLKESFNDIEITVINGNLE